jgi:hypothetical protein
MKSFNLVKDIIAEPVWQSLTGAVGVGYNAYNFGRQFDYNSTARDKAEAGLKLGLSVATAPLGPVIGGAISMIPETASYITDVIEGKRNGPPALEPGNEKNNQVGNIGHEVVNSNAFKTFFEKFGNWTLK